MLKRLHLVRHARTEYSILRTRSVYEANCWATPLLQRNTSSTKLADVKSAHENARCKKHGYATIILKLEMLLLSSRFSNELSAHLAHA